MDFVRSWHRPPKKSEMVKKVDVYQTQHDESEDTMEHDKETAVRRVAPQKDRQW